MVSTKKSSKFITTFIIILSLQLLTGINMAHAADNNVFYGVDINLHNVGVDIRVNDVPVYFDYSRGQLTLEVPAPETIVNGSNTLSINAFLPHKESEYEEGAFVNATLFKQDIGVTNSSKIKLLNVTLKLNNESVFESTEDFVGNKKMSEVKALDKDKIAVGNVATTLISPFPKWAWQSGKTITDSQETYD